MWRGGQALKVAEGVSGTSHPRLAPLLTLAATVFARTARMTVAEGLLRSPCCLPASGLFEL